MALMSLLRILFPRLEGWAGQGGDCDILCVELSQSENVIPIFFSMDRTKSSVEL